MEGVIIDVRDKLPWYRRLWTTKATMLLWVLFIGMCRPWHDNYHDVQIQFEDLMWYGLQAASLLFAVVWVYRRHVWREKTKPNTQQLETLDYANYIGTSECNLNNAQNSNRIVVHHDEHGKIVAVNT